MLSILMEQSQTIVTKSENLEKPTCILLVVLMLLVFILGNAYKGVIFTILTTLSFPVVPKTLGEVVDSDFFKFSISSCRTPEGTWTSMAKYDIDKFLEGEQGRLSISNMDLFKSLKRVHSVFRQKNDPPSIFLSMENGDELTRLAENSTVIPGSLIIFDVEHQVEPFKELITVITTNARMVLGQKINLSRLVRLWLLRRNAVARLTSPILISLVESGIYDRWKQHESLHLKYGYLNSAKSKLLNFYRASNRHISKNDNIIAYLFFKPYTVQRSHENEQPITMGFFFVFAQMLFYCLALCGIGFLVERLSKVKFGLLYVECRRIKICCCMLIDYR